MVLSTSTKAFRQSRYRFKAHLYCSGLAAPCSSGMGTAQVADFGRVVPGVLFYPPDVFAVGANSLMSPPFNVRMQLVQNHGVHRDKLFALKPINQEASGLRVIEIRELLLYEVEAFYRAAIIVLIVTYDQPLRHPIDLARIA
jgi:hypothetical protein